MGKMAENRNKTAYMGMAAAAALILSYVETLIPISFGMPGIKLGLPNLLIVLMLYLYGGREAFMVNAARIVLSACLFGSMFGMLYALAGALCSFSVMYICKKSGRFLQTGVSIAGGIAHNLGQCAVAAFIVKNLHIFYYAPPLTVAGALTGLLIGAAAAEILKILKKLPQNT